MSSSNLGFGYCGFGSSLCGFGSVATSPNSTADQLFITPDGSKGDAPLIDLQSRDYVLDSNSLNVGADSIQQMVQYALLTEKGSCSLPTFGLDMSVLKVFSTDSARKVDLAVRAALKHLTSKNLISIQSVDMVRQGQGAALVVVKWIQLQTGEFFAFTLTP